MQTDEARPRSARERILDTAGILFYRDGFHAVGVDTIVAESGVAKMTLYRHFPSKDELVAAYLARANEKFWGWIEGAIAGVDGPREKLIAIFEAIGTQATSPQCLGCSFQGAALEFPIREHPAHQVALTHKEMFRERVRTLAEQAGLKQPGELANQLLMLMDGAWIASRMYGPQNPAMDLVPAVRTLVDAHS
ncbi:MAG TPA: TetR/AcrR family transcriptional regulator [Symbiobacteriaceae bacterium]|nr:TetR/AcrR family transcriptional regulator [Symbiobacteriaceae bacterium]